MPTAPCSPTAAPSGMADVEDDESPPLLPHERVEEDMSQQKTQQQHPSSSTTPASTTLPAPNASSFFYPTPPTSSSSSMHRVSKEEAASGNSKDTKSNRAGADPSANDDKALSDALPSRSRRHTFAVASPLSGVLVKTPVPAAEISNPAVRRASQSFPTLHRSSSKSYPASRRSSMSKSKDVVQKLTEGVSPSQATPPQTPRTRSADEKQKPTSNPGGAKHSRGNSLNGTAAGAVPTPKGKLHVYISEGRGLRPSFDPYIVCQFQQAEYISDGPKNDASHKKEGHPGALPMQRTTSDYGRPMAIPMRSRQSSNSGHSSDPKENDDYVTDPQWDHDAIL